MPPAGAAGLARQVSAVLAIGRAMGTTADHEQVLGDVIEAVCRAMDARGGGFMLYDAARDELVLQKPAFGVHVEQVIGTYRVALSEGGNAARVFLSGEPYVANDARRNPRMLQRFIRLFGARNTITVPLLMAERPVGVFHAINKPGGFTPADQDLLSLVAPLLAACLRSAQLFKGMAAERRKLERAMAVHEALTRTALESRGLEPLCTTLSGLIGRPVLVLDAMRRVLAESGWTDPDPVAVARALTAATGAEGLRRLQVGAGRRQAKVSAVAIRLGPEIGGHVIIREAGKPLDPIDTTAVEQAATVFALELTRERAAFEAAHRRARDELTELLGADTPADVRVALLARLGFCPAGPWRVLRLSVQGERTGGRGPVTVSPEADFGRALRELLGALRVATRLLPWRDGLFAALPLDEAARLQGSAFARQLERLRVPALGLPTLRAGLGPVAHEPAELAASLRGAEQAVLAAHRLDLPARVVSAEELGVYRVLLGTNPREDHAAFVEQVLGPVRRADGRSRRPILSDTLRALVAADFNVADSAKRLAVHPNTVKYRLRKLTVLLGGDPARGERRMEVALALRIADMLNREPERLPG